MATRRQKARAERLRLVAANQTPPTIKVYAASPEIHEVMKHPSGTKFRGDFGTATEWPHDNFTHRRLVDGSISLNPAAKNGPKSDKSLGVRDAAYANRPKPGDVPPVVPLSAVPSEPEKSKPQSGTPKSAAGSATGTA